MQPTNPNENINKVTETAESAKPPPIDADIKVTAPELRVIEYLKNPGSDEDPDIQTQKNRDNIDKHLDRLEQSRPKDHELEKVKSAQDSQKEPDTVSYVFNLQMGLDEMENERINLEKANDVDRNIKEAKIYKQRQVQGNVLDIIYKEEAKRISKILAERIQLAYPDINMDYVKQIIFGIYVGLIINEEPYKNHPVLGDMTTEEIKEKLIYEVYIIARINLLKKYQHVNFEGIKDIYKEAVLDSGALIRKSVKNIINNCRKGNPGITWEEELYITGPARSQALKENVSHFQALLKRENPDISRDELLKTSVQYIKLQEHDSTEKVIKNGMDFDVDFDPDEYPADEKKQQNECRKIDKKAEKVYEAMEHEHKVAKTAIAEEKKKNFGKEGAILTIDQEYDAEFEEMMLKRMHPRYTKNLPLNPIERKKKIEKQLHKMNHVRSLAREEISRRNITDLKEKKRIFNKHLNEFNEKDEYEQDEILQSSRRDRQALYDRWDANEDARPRHLDRGINNAPGTTRTRESERRNEINATKERTNEQAAKTEHRQSKLQVKNRNANLEQNQDLDQEVRPPSYNAPHPPAAGGG